MAQSAALTRADKAMKPDLSSHPCFRYLALAGALSVPAGLVRAQAPAAAPPLPPAAWTVALLGLLIGLCALTLLRVVAHPRRVELAYLMMLGGTLAHVAGTTGALWLQLPMLSTQVLSTSGLVLMGAFGALFARSFVDPLRNAAYAARLFGLLAVLACTLPTLSLLGTLPAERTLLPLLALIAGCAIVTGLMRHAECRSGAAVFHIGWLLIFAAAGCAVAADLTLFEPPWPVPVIVSPTLAIAALLHAAALNCASQNHARAQIRSLEETRQTLAQRVETLEQSEQRLAHRIAQNQHELEAANKRLQTQADTAELHDPLTGLAHRHLLVDRIEHGIARARRHNARLALLQVDVKNFRAINAHFGRESGDALLTAIARRLTGACRAGDTVARLAGDDFVIVLEDVFAVEDVARVTQTIERELGRVFKIGDQRVRIAIHIGHASHPENGQDAETLLKSVDRDLFKAREAAATSQPPNA